MSLSRVNFVRAFRKLVCFNREMFSTDNAENHETIPKYENLPRIAQKGLNMIADTKNFETQNIVCTSGCNVGDGQSGVIVKVTITGEKNGNHSDEQLTVLCKIQKSSQEKRVHSNSFNAFKREVLMYKSVLGEFEKLQDEKGITKDQGFFHYPTVYMAEVDQIAKEAVIIMEDLRDRGFSLAPKHVPLPIELCEAVINRFAKLHAVSFVLKAEKPKIYKEYEDCHCLLPHILLGQSMTKVHKENFQSAMESIPDHPEIQAKLAKIGDNFIEIFKQLLADGHSSRHAIIGHGDSWINNFMFKLDATGKPQDLVLIDWQMSRYSSPIFELSYFIYLSTDKALRDAHLSRLLREYHQIFSDLVVKLGHNPDEIFSYAEYQSHWKKFGKFGLFMAIPAVPYLAMSPEEKTALDINEKRAGIIAAGKDLIEDESYRNLLKMSRSRVKDRLRDIVIEMDTLGYI